MSHACLFDTRMNCAHRSCQPGSRSRLDAFYAGDPNDSEVGRFPSPLCLACVAGSCSADHSGPWIPEGPLSPLVFNDEERAIDEHICAAMQGIMDLGLMCNEGELAHAVHTMQLFVIKHMLQRLGSPEFSEWYGS